MTTPAQLHWQVPADAVDRFEDYVRETHGDVGPYIRFEIEAAIREYLGEDELAPVEDALSTELETAPPSRPTVNPEQYRGGETRTLTYRINADLKEQFTTVADEADVDTYGQLLAAVLDAYADGGRAARIHEMLQAVVADCSGAAGQAADAIPASGAGGEQHNRGGER